MDEHLTRAFMPHIWAIYYFNRNLTHTFTSGDIIILLSFTPKYTNITILHGIHTPTFYGSNFDTSIRCYIHMWTYLHLFYECLKNIHSSLSHFSVTNFIFWISMNLIYTPTTYLTLLASSIRCYIHMWTYSHQLRSLPTYKYL